MAEKCSHIHHTVWTCPLSTTTDLARKYNMSGQHHEGNADQKAMCNWSWGAGIDFYHSRSFKPVQRWQKYMDHSGDFAEK